MVVKFACPCMSTGWCASNEYDYSSSASPNVVVDRLEAVWSDAQMWSDHHLTTRCAKAAVKSLEVEHCAILEQKPDRLVLDLPLFA